SPRATPGSAGRRASTASRLIYRRVHPGQRIGTDTLSQRAGATTRLLRKYDRAWPAASEDGYSPTTRVHASLARPGSPRPVLPRAILRRAARTFPVGAGYTDA